MKHELLTRAELAERFGKDERTITNWVQAGMPQRMKSGRPVYSWPECLEWREKQIREDARAIRHAANDEERAKQLADAKLRTAIAEADQAEIDLAKARGEVVPVLFMRDEFSRVVFALRGKLLASPDAWSARLNLTLEQRLGLRDCVNELLPVLGELADDDQPDAKEAKEA